MDIVSSHASESNLVKHCNTCDRDLPATEEYFPINKKTGKFKVPCRQCRNSYNASYHQAHKEEISAQRKIYYQEHQEHLKAYSAHYRAEHPEETKQYSARYNKSDRRKALKARYNAKHRERNLAYNKYWHEHHKEHEREYRARYNAEHREQRLAYYIRRRQQAYHILRERQKAYRRTESGRLLHLLHENQRRVRKLSLEGTLTLEQIQRKLKLQKYACYYCDKKFKKNEKGYVYHLEHTVPVSRAEYSPRHDENYVVLACPECNTKKKNKLPHEWPDGGRLL